MGMATITVVVLQYLYNILWENWVRIRMTLVANTTFQTSSGISIWVICCNCLLLLNTQNMSCSHFLAAIIYFCVWLMGSFCQAYSHWLAPQGCTIQHHADHTPNGSAYEEFCVSACIPFTFRGWQTAGTNFPIYENTGSNYNKTHQSHHPNLLVLRHLIS